MDLNLPDVDGWEATRLLKEAPETQAIPIMAMTAHAIAGDQERALQAGCDDYHAKPVEFQRLLTQIEAPYKTNLASNERSACGSMCFGLCLPICPAHLDKQVISHVGYSAVL